jgi:hypothetical protein
MLRFRRVVVQLLRLRRLSCRQDVPALLLLCKE